MAGIAIRDAGSRLLPLGWPDFIRQVAIWLGFGFGYEIARALADPGPDAPLRNAERVIHFERHFGGLHELDVQRWALEGGAGVVHALNWTYWLSQFAVLSAALLWVYLRHNHAYLRLRNTLFVVNLLGLILYVAMPTAPPRLVPGTGLIDTLAGSVVSFHTALVDVLANPYAAMPSLHAADALVLAVTLASIVRPAAARVLFMLWPLWVSFCLLASGNHFWLDVVVGAGLGALVLVAARLVASGRLTRLAT